MVSLASAKPHLILPGQSCAGSVSDNFCGLVPKVLQGFSKWNSDGASASYSGSAAPTASRAPSDPR